MRSPCLMLIEFNEEAGPKSVRMNAALMAFTRREDSAFDARMKNRSHQVKPLRLAEELTRGSETMHVYSALHTRKAVKDVRR